MTQLTDILSRWDSNEGKPYKGKLIDWAAYMDSDGGAEPPLSCMCAQGQVLHLLAGWSPEKLRDAEQDDADKETAKSLNISIAHSILLRSINDSVDGAPSIVLTNPEKILGDQAHVVLAFWLHLDGMTEKDWAAAWDAARDAAWDAARDAAWDAARDAAWDAAGAAAGAAVRASADAAVFACGEIQGARIMREKGQSFFFLPLFGFADPEAIPALPADYGKVV